jgi:hypothetical protein
MVKEENTLVQYHNIKISIKVIYLSFRLDYLIDNFNNLHSIITNEM